MSAIVAFTLNEEKVELANVSPCLTLLEWLRAQTGLTGTKKMCGEGGCGCCVVSATRNDPATGKLSTIAINSCLCPIYSVNGWSITTVEGIGGSKKGFHPIQKAVAQHNATQCGYCTPGFVMSMYSLKKEKNDCSLQDIEDNFDGNICRCTGYRPILDAMKSLTTNKSQCHSTDIEDFCPKICSSCPVVSGSQWVTPCRNHDDPVWYFPTSLANMFEIFKTFECRKFKLVCGNTGAGIFKHEERFDAFVNINSIQELNRIQSTDDSLIVGACVSISTLIHTLQELNTKSCQTFPYLAAHMKKIANVPVRNVGSWAGNFMLSHDNDNFPSDIYTIMEAVGASVTIATSTDQQQNMSLTDFLKFDMKKSVIVSLHIPFSNEYTWFRSFKISQRAENSHAYVNAAFKMEVDPKDNKVKGGASFVFGGIGTHSFSAKLTEAFIVGKDIIDPETLKGALRNLSEEIQPNYSLISASVEYRKNLALNLFYKFYLAVVDKKTSPRFKSAAIPYDRPISKGSQDFGTDQTQYPLTRPMPKMTSGLQASGEAQYTTDIPKQNGELAAVFVLSSQANSKILKIDATSAMKVKGAVKVVTANDIPGVNTFTGISDPEPILVDDFAEYAGQPVAMVIADTQAHANEMVEAVVVQYQQLGKPILTIEDAISRKSFHEDEEVETIRIGNIEDALSNSDHVISGELSCESQYHFHMETQVSLAIPEDDGYIIHSSTQNVRSVQKTVSSVLGIDCNRVNVQVKRVGGAYGAKIVRSSLIAGASALGAFVTGRPVRMHMDLETNMNSIGKRCPYSAKYSVSSTKTGLLTGVKIDVYTDPGCYKSENAISEAMNDFDNTYKCQNWLLTPRSCKTNTASNTYTRSPGFLPVIFIIESIMDHLAMSLKMNPLALKELNMYNKGDISYVTDPNGMPLNDCNIRDLWKDVVQTAEVTSRQQQIASFNEANRWRKRGLSMVPMRYGIMWTDMTTSVLVNIYESDGTVAIVHGGVELGQGINTRVAQVAALALGIDISMIVIKPTNTLTNPNGSCTGGSVTSEMNCRAVLDACKALNQRLEIAIEEIKKDGKSNPEWIDVVKRAHSLGIDLSQKGFIQGKSTLFYDYNAYGVTCAEVEIDVLTGQLEILRVDILNDCGESLNPDIDVGQVEGGFVMGLGYWLTEKLVYDPSSGKLLTNNTWEYKPPSSKDIPQDMRVRLLKNTHNSMGMMRSKGTGEPPMVMSSAVVFAVKRAIESARKDAGNDDLVILSAPVTVEKIQMMCCTAVSQLQF